MAELDIGRQIRDLEELFLGISKVIDPVALENRIAELETLASDPNIWNDQANAQKVTTELSRTKAQLDHLHSIDQDIKDWKICARWHLKIQMQRMSSQQSC